MELSNIAKQIQKEIEKSSNILLHCHPYPDPDSIGSVIAMKRYLQYINKNVTAIIGDSSYPTNLNTLHIENEIESKSYIDINTVDYDLFIILDSSSKSQITQRAEVEFPKTMKTIVIDHHKTNTEFGDINLLDVASASTTQIITKLFKEWTYTISQEIALPLYLGLFADTGGFKYLNTTPEVLKVASELASINPNFHKAVFDIENSKEPIEIEMQGLALSSIQRFHNGKIVLSKIPYEIVKEKKLSIEQAMEGLVADKLRSVYGWDIVASLVEAEPNITTISLRTRDETRYDLTKVVKVVGVNGGGHPGAAGTTIYKNIEDASNDLIKNLLDIFGESL
ncbi:MAG TPA: DHH family phosphoesterase [Candidatus Dojkabacteria bacterium]|nr:DHH family phosphoesterase [Candidatus Dojkabacteria bacterium]